MPEADLAPDLCVIGAGSAGLSIAAGAVQMGASVVLIERGEMGGDCLNYGCVPSKALLAAAKQAATLRHGADLGVADVEPVVDFARVMDHVHGVIAGIAPHDSQERFEGLGVTVLRADARFVGPDAVAAGGRIVRARRFVVATGSTATTPPIAGLADIPYLTNETIFENRILPRRLLIIGAGPIGMEMAQAHRRLGADVTALEALKPLGKDDPELAAVVLERLAEEGVDIRAEAKIERAEKTADGYRLTLAGGETIDGSHLLVAAGRKPNLDGLDLEAANVRYDRRGVEVDQRLRSVSNKRVFAAGDVAGALQFTHVASYHAGVVIQNALFRLPAKADHSAIPWVTYTDPELAQVGMTEAEARKEHGESIRVLRWPFAENDRAMAERRTDGLVKAVTSKSGRVLGCGIVGAGAGDLIAPWALAVSGREKVGKLARVVLPYPTRGEASKRAAGSFYTPKLYSDRTRWLVRLLARLG